MFMPFTSWKSTSNYAIYIYIYIVTELIIYNYDELYVTSSS